MSIYCLQPPCLLALLAVVIRKRYLQRILSGSLFLLYLASAREMDLDSFGVDSHVSGTHRIVIGVAPLT